MRNSLPKFLGGNMKEKLEAKLAAYQKEFEQTKANANALQGAIQAVSSILAELEVEPAKAE